MVDMVIIRIRKNFVTILAKARLGTSSRDGPTEIHGHVRNRLGVPDHRGQSK